MNKNLLIGMAMAAMAIPVRADYAQTAVFDASNVIIPSSVWTPAQPWTADVWVVNTGKRYEGPQGFDNPDYNRIWATPEKDAAGNDWFAADYTLTPGSYDGNAIEWTSQTGPFSSDERYKDQQSYRWITSDIMGDIYLRRHFYLADTPAGEVYLTCGHDDAPSQWYLNGQLVYSVEEGWDDGLTTVLLTPEQKSLLRKGDNVLAVHVHQNWGGALADCGLYSVTDHMVAFLPTLEAGAWDCYYKTLGGNGDIAPAVEAGAFNLDADLSDWTAGVGPLSNSDDRFRTTYWDSDHSALLVRRNFTLSPFKLDAIRNGGSFQIKISYDEYPVVYLNGTEVCRYNEWNDNNYATYTLTQEQLGLLREGDNVIGVSLQQGGGGGHIDFGAYGLAPAEAWAASPFKGSEPTFEGRFYLYQVETDRWIQPHMNSTVGWTTHAELGPVGFDIETRKPGGFDDKWQIYTDMSNKGELAGHLWMDTPGDIYTQWEFIPVELEGGGIAYNLKLIATDPGQGGENVGKFLGANDSGEHGGLAFDGQYRTWQLVTREERIERMEKEVKMGNGPVDATFLIPWFDLGREDNRRNLWSKTVNNPSGGGLGFDGTEGYPIQEYWHEITMDKRITLTGLPEGTYGFAVQAFYRDGSIDEGEKAGDKRQNGTEVIRANYFANTAKAPVKSIFDDAKTTKGNGFEFYVENLGLYVPNSVGEAANAMFPDNYVNPYIQTSVTDGSLTIGLEKPEATWHDWLIEKRYYLQYVSTEAGTEDLTGLQSQLADLIKEAKELPSTPNFENAINAAEDVLENASSASALLDGIAALNQAISIIRGAQGDIQAFIDIEALGFKDAEAREQFAAANSRDEYVRATRTLRYARRLSVADTEEHSFEGNEPQEGKFYLYNVGRKQFLCGGSDWGAHAALGMPGVELTLTEKGENANGTMKYLIETGLYNGENNHFLGYRGYMDTEGVDNGGFAFIPVEGLPGVYNMVQGDYPDVHVAWNPYASVDSGNSDETTVGTECRDLNPADPFAQWMLISKADRDALMENASEDNPVDVSYYIASPNVNNREKADEVWTLNNFGIWGDYGHANRNSYTFELWNKTGELSQLIEGLPAGTYEIVCQGFYRNGTHAFHDNIDGTECVGQANLPELRNAYLYAGDDMTTDVALPNILWESGNAPGEGANLANEDGSIVYHIPEYCDQAQNFFKSGLYKVSTKFEWNPEDADAAMPIGIYVDTMGDEPGCWTVVDNFRLYYLGDGQQTNGVDAVEESLDASDAQIYNLQGIRVKDASQPGIYIQGGRKFVVTK